MITKEEFQIISKIAHRAQLELSLFSDSYLTTIMDIENAHACNPLDLEAFLSAPAHDFAHDVYGIRLHLNRKTKRLENCFVPRFSKTN